MFKPHYSLCVCHNKQRLIVVLAGLCKIGNDEKKGINRTGNDLQWTHSAVGIPQRKFKTKIKTPIKKKGKIKYVRRTTGEAQVVCQAFEEALERSWPECPQCSVCGAPLGYQVRTFHGSHVLAKSTFPAFKLWRRNIWLCCLSCHSGWDHGLEGKNRSNDVYAEKRRIAAILKQFYYWLSHQNSLINDPKKLEILFKEFEG